MDLRNSKATLLAHIKKLEAANTELTAKVETVFSAGMDGIDYVGACNYHEREQEARSKLFSAYYGEEITPEQAEDMF